MVLVELPFLPEKERIILCQSLSAISNVLYLYIAKYSALSSKPLKDKHIQA